MSAMTYSIPVLEKFRPITPGVGGGPVEFCGTHRAVVAGDKAFLQNLELIDEMPEGPMGKIGREDLEKFCEATNRKIGEGQFPQMVLRHPRAMVPGDVPRDDSIGRVCSPLSVRMSPETGRWTVYADVEFSEANFREYVLSNRYPRRSVEIADDTLHIAQVAMLGRSRPAAGVRDVFFDGDRKTRTVGTEFETRFEERRPMTNIETAKATFDAMTDEEKAEFMKLCSANGDGDGGSGDEDPEKEKDPVPSDTANFEAARKIGEQASQIEMLRAQNSRNERRLLELEIRPQLEAMFTHGGYTLDVEKELQRMVEMPTAEERSLWFEHIRTHYKQRLTASGLVGGPLAAARGAFVPPGFAEAEFTKEDCNRVVDFCSARPGTPMTFEEGAAALGLGKKLGGARKTG